MLPERYHAKPAKNKYTKHKSVGACSCAVASGSHHNLNLHQVPSINRTSSRAFSLCLDLTGNRCFQRTSGDKPISQKYMSRQTLQSRSKWLRIQKAHYVTFTTWLL